ncbi:unnamed protein product [Plutella xylostella]|uniref:(diamondback moth) hypothetical protein n=1 Tax=Plutella xylostella TaxID=51655 RepID=A0A8S4FVR0_PLUXY|nr:unnamed protein product [Plutella xylostella]
MSGCRDEDDNDNPASAYREDETEAVKSNSLVQQEATTSKRSWITMKHSLGILMMPTTIRAMRYEV